MKKRMLAAILSGIMVITGISACSGNAATSSENSSASTTTTTTTKAETTTTTAATTTTTTTATQNPESAPAETKGDSVQFSQNLMPGWNLGNQLESNSDGTPSETAWGNPVITENLIKQVKAQGFKSIRIAPSLGDLKEVSGTMPHPVGSVTASYKLDKKGKLTARLILPTGTDGVFVWKGKEYQLKSGEQVLTVE